MKTISWLIYQQGSSMEGFAFKRVLLVGIALLSVMVGLHAKDVASTIAQNVQQELELQLAASEHVAVEGTVTSTLQEKISNFVSRALDNHLFATLQTHAKNEVYEKDPVYKLDKSVPFIYKVPRWPIQAHFFLKKDLVAVDFNFLWATQAYGASGGTRDVSDLVFQEGPFCVKDILLASKLIDKGLATPTSKYKFLELLKDQQLCFDASLSRQEVAFSYVRHFLRGDIALGLQVPVVRKKHTLKFQSTLSTQKKSELESQNPDFFTLYPNGLIDFFKDILARKCMTFNECDSCTMTDVETGIGDVELFFNYEIMWRHCERFFAGLHLLLPTSKRRDVYKLWGPELGDSSFTQLSAFTSLLFSHGRWINPHLFVQGTYAFPSRVFRRVPRIRQTSDVTPNAVKKYGDDFTPYGNYIQYTTSDVPGFCERDTTIRRFSDVPRKIRIRRGAELFARLGNTMERLFHERIFFDLFYDLILKGRDYVGHRRENFCYDPSILTRNSYETAHRIGGSFTCQFDNSWRAFLGGLYTFAGRNSLRTFEIEGALTLEF